MGEEWTKPRGEGRCGRAYRHAAYAARNGGTFDAKAAEAIATAAERGAAGVAEVAARCTQPEGAYHPWVNGLQLRAFAGKLWALAEVFPEPDRETANAVASASAVAGAVLYAAAQVGIEPRQGASLLKASEDGWETVRHVAEDNRVDPAELKEFAHTLEALTYVHWSELAEHSRPLVRLVDESLTASIKMVD